MFCKKSGVVAVSLVMVFLTLSFAISAPKWRSIGPGVFGALVCVGFHPTNPEIMVAGGDMGNAFITHDGGTSWEILGQMGKKPFAQPGYRGAYGEVKFDPRNPDIIWIGGTHGLYKSEDGGKNWQLKVGGNPIQIWPIEIDPTDSNIVYAGTGMCVERNASWASGTIYKTTDCGKTWKEYRPGGAKETDTFKYRNWFKIAIDPQSKYVAGKGHLRIYVIGYGGFFVSEDAGESWTSLEEKMPGGAASISRAVNGKSGCYHLTLVPGKGRSRIFATFKVSIDENNNRNDGVYCSDDGGKTWVEKNKGLERATSEMIKQQALGSVGYDYSLIVSPSSNPNILYWGYKGGVFKSTDQGENWYVVTKYPQNFIKQSEPGIRGCLQLAVSPSNPDYVAYTEWVDGMLSKDGGKTWEDPFFDYGEVFKTNALKDRLASSHKMRSRGVQLIVPLALAVDPFNENNISIGYSDVGLQISRDGGEWWEWAYDGIGGGDRNYCWAVVYDPAVKDKLYVGTGGWGMLGNVYQSVDGGKTFNIIGIPDLTEKSEKEKKKRYYVNALVIDPTSSVKERTIYAATTIGIYKTTDGGKTWNYCSSGLGTAMNIDRLVIDHKNPKRLYAGSAPSTPLGNKPGLYKSENSGKNWVQIGSDKIGAVKTISICKEKPNVLYVVSIRYGTTDTGVWAPTVVVKSDDYGETWQEIDSRRSAFATAHPQNPDIVYLGLWAQDVTKEEVGLFRSMDGGKNWQEIDEGTSFTLSGKRNNLIFDSKNFQHIFLLQDSGVFEGWDSEVPK